MQVDAMNLRCARRTRRVLRACSGVTLVELMVAVAVLGIMAAIGLPSFQGFIASNQLRSATQDLYGSLQLARIEAIRRNARVTVCKANTSLTNCDNSGAWHNGWIVFLDNTVGATPAVDSGDTILSTRQALPAPLRVLGNGGANGTATYVSFTAEGQSRQLNRAMLAGTLRVCSTSPHLEDGKRARDLVISVTGRIASDAAPALDATCPGP
ncbi:GspH/FimT family pseudopilin [Tepidimonas charontis]|uniref:Type II secretion system protein H n=1 Tax=Tepidimonas charontis TaxID=2267262 RepID=A0A554XKA1_9BURK|nr:GspH/FimT family pseudopilin [Tepidimonas charontis]TSE36255.1 Verru-Chthon cassette protein D [Tepidimonas charontis]